MVEEQRCWVQLEQVEVVLKNTEQVQMRPKKIGTSGELGPKQAKEGPTESSGRDKVECDECGKSLSKACLLNHKRIVHRGETPYKCWVEDCGIGFASSSRLADHKRVNHGYPKMKCKVEGCGSEFLLRSEFHSHCQTHQGKIECDECGKSISPRYLSAHKKEVHRGEKPFACKEIGCTERFSRQIGLGDHERIVHGYPKLKCKFGGCSTEFSGYEDLRNHQRNHARIECTECGKNVIKKNIHNHMKWVHQGERPFECDVTGCEKRYFNKTSLADHMRSMHGFPKLKCSSGQCTAEFVYKKQLLVHAKEHLI